ncbi:MAG: mobile mystery protein B [Candidatus Celaenobacter polaris]|nr:mobile mystery protein B [Candidatus Celaenobacter polaris]
MPNFDYPKGATPIDSNEIVGLLLTHITTRSELDRWEQDNIVMALAWLDQNKPKDIFNERFIKELHRRMFGNVWKWAGKFRRSDKNIGCSWNQIPICVKNLCDDAKLWLELKSESSDEIAVRFHHRLVSIHPFPNGNGRHARLMTDILLENILGRSRFSWGREDLSSASDSRRRYIEALHAADGGNYKPLLEFVRT